MIRKTRILLIEDESVIALDMRRSLEILDYDVIGIATNGDAAIWMAADMRPDLVLMDIRLQGKISGIEAANTIQKKYAIPVVFVTAHSDEQTLRNARAIEPYGIVMKPIRSIDMYTSIETALQRFGLESRIRESEEKYRLLVEEIRDVIYSIDENGIITYLSPAVESITGYAPDELIGSSYTRLFHKEDNPLIEEMSQKVIAGDYAPIEIKIVTKDGGLRFVRIVEKAIVENGALKGVRGVLTDVTEKKRSEDAYHALVDKSLQGMLIYQNGRFVFVNRAFADMVGYSSEALLSFRKDEINMLVHPDDQVLVWSVLNNPAIIDNSGKKNIRLISRDGAILHTDAYLWGIDYSGAPSVQIAFIDTTDRVHAEENLRKQDELFRLITDNVRDVIRLVDVPTMKYIYANRHTIEMFGVPPEEYIGMPLGRYLDESSRRELYAIISDELEHDGERDPFRSRMYELRETVHPHGAYIWTENKATFVRDADGKPISILSITRDITRRKTADERLKAALHEKDVLLKEVNHRVKNNFQMITGLLNLHERNIKDEEALKQLRDLQYRIRAMLLIYEKLYQSKDVANIHMSEYIRAIVYDLYRIYCSDPLGIELDIETGDVDLNIERAIPCGMMIHELVTNAFTHAFPAGFSGKPAVRIKLAEIPQSTIELVVSDNGVGMPEKRTSEGPGPLGLMLVEMLATEQLDGALEMKTNGGTTFTIRFER